MRNLIMWQYTNDPNDINEALMNYDENWEDLRNDTNHGCYVVFWKV